MRGVFAGLSLYLSGRIASPSVLALRARASLAVVLFGALFLAACGGPVTPPPQAPQHVSRSAPERTVAERTYWSERPGYIQPNHMGGQAPVRVALLLPLGDQSPQTRAIAASMRDAAELAVFRSGRADLLLLTKDTRGTVPGAQDAAREAIAEGAEIILGPLFANNVEAITPITQNAGISVVAFSSDSQVADQDVYLLGFTPEQEVERVAEFAMSEGYFDFAAMIPFGDYGSRVDTTFANTVSRYGGLVVQTIPYDSNADDFRDEAGALAYTYGVTGMDREDKFGEELGAEFLVPKDPGFTAVLLPEGGTALRLLAPSLPYNDIDNRVVRFLGTGLWDDQRLWREPALNQGWFAAPDPEARNRFSTAYEIVYAERPHRLASLAYDAVTLAASLADAPAGQRFNQARLTNTSGFSGVDGIFRFRSGGSTERGLAVLEVDNGEVTVASPAPLRFGIVREGTPIYKPDGVIYQDAAPVEPSS